MALVPAVLLLHACGGSDEAKTHTVGGTLSGVSGAGVTLQLNSANDQTVSSNGSFTFTTPLAEGTAYTVSVKTQPTAQTCVISNGSGSVSSANVTNVTVACTDNSYAVGGKVRGLSGLGLVLQNNSGDDRSIVIDGDFTFATHVRTGQPYSVSVKTQPTSPPQTCVVSSGAGNIAAADVTNVSIDCSDNTYAIGGQVSGLAGSGLVLQDNGTDDKTIGADGTFQFATRVRTGFPYAVSVKQQPTNPWQTCAVAAGAGNVVAVDISTVSVTCTTNIYAIGGSVSGLTGSALTLALNGGFAAGGQEVQVGSNGPFAFPALASGSDYTVTVKTQPAIPAQTCVAGNTTGTVGGSAVTNISVSCTTNSYSVGAHVTGLTGSGLQLQLNGGQDLPIAADGDFTFPISLLSGTAYNVAIKSQTSTHREVCAARNASGVVTNSAITVQIDCTVALGFAYILGQDNQVRGYAIDPQNGALLPLDARITLSGTNHRSMVASPNGSTLYVGDLADNTISAFSVDSDKGALSQVGTPVSTGPALSGAFSLVIDPSGKFLYVTNIFAGNVALFSIDQVTGGLSAQGTVATFTASRIPGVAITPDGAFLYLLTLGSTSTLRAYSIDATTGALTPGPTTSLTPGDDIGTGVAVDPTGRFLYIQSNVRVQIESIRTTLRPFAIDPGTGALTAKATTDILDNNGGPFVIDPSGKFLYLLDTHNSTAVPSNHIDAFSIDGTTGVLTNIGAHLPIHAQTAGIACDASGRFVFVGNSGPYDRPNWFDVSGFEITASGMNAGLLSPAGTGTERTGLGNTFALITVIE